MCKIQAQLLLSEAEGWIAPLANLEIFWVIFWPLLNKWAKKCPFLANLFLKTAIFSSKKRRQDLNNFESIFGQFAQKNVTFWPIIFQAKKEANFEQLWVNFWPILNKWAKKRSIFGQFKQKNGHFERFWVTFWPIYAKKMAIFEAKNVEANLEKLWVNFLCKKMAIFPGKKRRPILSNFGSILGQFMQKNGHFF